MQEALNEFFKKIDENILLLPDFQRAYKWDISKQQNLLSSVILDFPVGSSLTLEGNATDFASRKIGDNQQTLIEDNYTCLFLLDGQQRTTTLYNAFNDIFDTRKFVDSKETNEVDIETRVADFVESKSSSMRVRWFISFPSDYDHSNLDPFNLLDLDFKKNNLDSFEPSDISEIFVGKRFSINNKQKTKPFSPFFEVSNILFDDVDKHYRVKYRKLEEFCVNENIMPLYLISREDKAHFVKGILKKIALKRADTLQDIKYNDETFIKSCDFNALLDDFDSFNEALSSENYPDILKQIFENAAEHWSDLVYSYLKKDVYEKYKLPEIKTSDIRRAIPIFCHINEGGMQLDDFDLLAARAARKLSEDGKQFYSLADVVKNRFNSNIELPKSILNGLDADVSYFNLQSLDNLTDGLPDKYIKQSILALCSILAKANERDFFANESIRIKTDDSKSKTLLSLSTMQIRNNIEIACVAVIRALIFLCLRCGVYNSKKLHYTLMLQPIAFLLSRDDVWSSKKALDKIEYWYWVTYFSGDYLYDQKTVCTRDINLLFDFVVRDIGGEKLFEKTTDIFTNSNFNSKDLLLGKTEERAQTGIHLGILQFVLSQKPYDFCVDETTVNYPYKVKEDFISFIDDSSLHDHHIMPLDMIKIPDGKNSQDLRSSNSRFNSPLNRVYISSSANLALSNIGPDRYFSFLGEDRSHVEHILNSNFIPRDAMHIMRGANSIENAERIMEARFDLIVNGVQGRLITLKASF